MQHCVIHNLSEPGRAPIQAQVAETFWNRFKGLMLRRQIGSTEALLIDESRDSRVNTAIHMLFMNFDICAIWINEKLEVVDVKIAKKWSLSHIPIKPARYILEASPDRYQDFQPGNLLTFTYD